MKLLSFLSFLLKKTGTSLLSISEKIYQKPIQSEPIQSIRVKPWFTQNGDRTFRLDYELSSNSIVIDLGGYEGQWAADIFCRYECFIYVFEPFKKFALNIKNRFKDNRKVMVLDYGLSNTTSKEKLNISGDSSSVHKNGQKSVEIQLIKIEDFLNEKNISFVDLIKINIEGGEYDLLEHLVLSETVLRFKNIQVQFHDFVPNAENRMNAIKLKLSKTHFLTYEFEFVWENWQIRS